MPLNNVLDNQRKNEVSNSYNNTNIKLGLVTRGKQDIRTVTLQSSRIASTTKSVNSGDVPLNLLDQTTPPSATIMKIASTNVNDTITGSGAEMIQIVGLDENYDEIIDIVILNGQTSVDTNLSFLRINQLLVVRSNNAGNDTFNLGTISINSTGHGIGTGLPNVELFGTIETLKNVSTLGIYTVPKNWSAISTHYKVTADVSGKTMFCSNSLKFKNIPRFTLVELTFSSSAINFVLDGIPNIPEMSDIFIETQLQSGVSSRTTVWWSFILFKISEFPQALPFTTENLAL